MELRRHREGLPAHLRIRPPGRQRALRGRVVERDRHADPGVLTRVRRPGDRSRIVSPPRAGTLVLAGCPGAGTISVTITPTGSTAGACRPRLRVSVTPGSVTTGRPARFRILVLAVLGRYRVPVAGASVAFGGRRLRTDARGSVIVRLTLHRAQRPYAIRVHAAGLIPGAASVRALSSR